MTEDQHDAQPAVGAPEPQQPQQPQDPQPPITVGPGNFGGQAVYAALPPDNFGQQLITKSGPDQLQTEVRKILQSGKIDDTTR